MSAFGTKLVNLSVAKDLFACRALPMAALIALGGCSSFSVPTVEPWVKPYERERLADPIMRFSRNALPEKHIEHVRDVREGGHGATGVQGGGCGCN